MDNYTEVKMIYSKLQTAISQAQQEIQQLLAELSGKQKKHPAGNLRIIRNHGRFQYYHVPEGEKGNGRYIPKGKRKIAEAIAQRDYNSRTKTILQKQLTSLEAFTNAFDFNAVINTMATLHPGRQALITPIIPTQEQFITKWLSQPYKGHPFSDAIPEYFTATGIRVRSKSEVIIADTLTRLGIPFRYEQPHIISNIQAPRETSHNTAQPSRSTSTFTHHTTRNAITVHPDFTCLNPRTREEIIWEHFGRMGEPDYAHNAILKISQYTSSGFTLGKNFIATFEDDETPLATRQVQTYAKELLL